MAYILMYQCDPGVRSKEVLCTYIAQSALGIVQVWKQGSDLRSPL